MASSFPLRAAVLAVPVLTAIACAGDSAPSESTTTIRDSTGITIVENSAPKWTETDAWTLGPTPTLRIGGLDGAPEYELFRVAGARRLDDGRIVIANSGTHELRFYDADGTYLQSVGREGDGPGEFRRLRLITAYGSDHLPCSTMASVEFRSSMHTGVSLESFPSGPWGGVG